MKNKIATICIIILLALAPLIVFAQQQTNPDNVHNPAQIAVLLVNTNTDLISKPELKGKEALLAVQLVNINTDALANRWTVADVKTKVAAIYKENKLAPPSNIAGNSGFSWTYVFIGLLLAIAIFFAIKYKNKLLSFKGKIPVEKLASTISALRKKGKSIQELQAMISANIVEAEENLNIARDLVKQKENGTIINLREPGEVEKKEKELNFHLEKLSAWTNKANEIKKSILKIGKVATKNLNVADDIEKDKLKILAEHESNNFSDEVNNQIENLKKDIEQQRETMDNSKRNLLLLIKLTTDINFSLSDYKKFTIQYQIDCIKHEKDAIKSLVKGIKKGDKEKVMTSIDTIYLNAMNIRDNLIGLKDRYKKLSMQTETLLEMLEETNSNDESTRKAIQALFRKEIEALTRVLKVSFESKKMSDKERIPFLFRKLEELKGDEASAWDELRTAGVNVDEAKDTIQKIRKLRTSHT